PGRILHRLPRPLDGRLRTAPQMAPMVGVQLGRRMCRAYSGFSGKAFVDETDLRERIPPLGVLASAARARRARLAMPSRRRGKEAVDEPLARRCRLPFPSLPPSQCVLIDPDEARQFLLAQTQLAPLGPDSFAECLGFRRRVVSEEVDDLRH